MTAMASPAAGMDGGTAPRVAGPDIGTLTTVELRKMADTRSGKWLLGIVAVIALAVAVIQFFAFHSGDQTFPTILQVMVLGTSILLPVVGILLVTSEWSQNTALITFTLVPQRHRILVAKLLAGVALSVLVTVLCILLSAAGNALSSTAGDGAGDWHFSAGLLGKALLFELLGIWMGMGFGIVSMSSALAIVLYFALPTAWSIVGSVVHPLNSASHWLDTSSTFGPLLDDSMSGRQWAQLLVSSLVWLLVPIVAGAIRLHRTEIK